VGASAAYRQVASVGGSAAQHSRKSKQGGAACESKRKKVREAEAVALHGGHPGGSASGKSPSTKGFPHGPVLRGRQSKDILFWYGSSSGGRLQRPCAACVRAGCVRAGCVRGACGVRAVRARRPPSETRRRVCHVSSGDQHRSSKKDSSVGEAGCGLCEYGRAGCVRCGEASVKARYLHGVSARHRSWYESGSSSASNRGGAGRCMGGAWAVPGGGAGRGRLFETRGGACCTCMRGGRRRAKAARSPAAAGDGWTQGHRGASPKVRCGARGARRGEGKSRRLRNLMWCWSPHPRVSGVGIRVYHPCPHPSHPPHRAPTRGRACWPHTSGVRRSPHDLSISVWCMTLC
jgi:hypothetical protein